MESEILVSVLCTTYNHEKFIEEALKGILNQKTNFRYEVIVHDDASTDKTQQIIRAYEKKYPGQIRSILQKVNKRKCTLKVLYPYTRGKYIAFCEGDDFWIDENKLQIQVDFMEKHSEYGMCLHNAIKLNDATGEKRVLKTFEKEGTYSQRDQILMGFGSDFPAFASYMIRAELLKNIPQFFFEAGVLDYPLRQYYANCAPIYYFEKPMSVYRVAVEQSYMRSVSENQEFYNDYTLRMIRFFEKFNDYTDYRFDDIIKLKLQSDYLGFCTSVDEKIGKQRAIKNGLDVQYIGKNYEVLNINYINQSIKKMNTYCDCIFIYGISRLAKICMKQLACANIEYEGFVISDNQIKTDEYLGKKVFYLSEVNNKYDNPGFILAVQPVNVNKIENELKKYGFNQYCKPYMLQEE